MGGILVFLYLPRPVLRVDSKALPKVSGYAYESDTESLSYESFH
jgi:hypothetical protein